MEKKRWRVYYSGRVQGVGFRYRAQCIAEISSVRGWARNLPDGRVEIIAEASEDVLREFIAQLDVAMHGHIRGKEVIVEQCGPGFSDFSVKS